MRASIGASIGATFTNELAVMCDTFRPLYPTKAALDIDDLNYPKSWEGEHFPATLGQPTTNGAHPNGKANGKAPSAGKKKTSAKTPAKATLRSSKKASDTWM